MKSLKVVLIVFSFLFPLILEAKDPQPVLKTVSKYRKINKTSNDALEWGIKNVGVGNVIFSSGELPFGKEETYKDIRDTFYYKVDNSIHCRVYYPGTLKSLVEIVRSQNPKAVFEKRWALLWVLGDNYERQAKMSFITDLDGEEADVEQQRFDLLPYTGGEDQDFSDLDLSKILDGSKPGTYSVIVSVFLKFRTGEKEVTRVENGALVTRKEPTYTDYMISTGEFKYIVK